jgi:hypothetical protein
MTTEQKVIKNKVGLLTLAQTLGNVSQACKVMGFSRDSFYLSIPKIPSWGRRDYSLMTQRRSRLRIDDSISGRRRIGLQRRT